jgi:hypothetical protein
MGIVNAGQLAVYEEIPAELLELVEDVLPIRVLMSNREANAEKRQSSHCAPAPMLWIILYRRTSFAKRAGMR